MTVPELKHLQAILRRALVDPASVGIVVRDFLEAYDALPDAFDALPGSAWQAMRAAAYELRFYAPDEAPTDDVLVGDADALRHIREMLERVPESLSSRGHR